ncbi:amylo-alpha-1,6-glucosidase [Roseiflexus castenholzii]|uniref:beta-fructofuranosidase n=1 Tax=Roseiflexus castenholzii (strain DSM 13941 / HLO8) TaxID=383372 RepID=A7NM41_ROSCS|nr:glycoside hydrolase 100 family protein [Roseiflexus castenholzii]ABU58596.1 glycogen debranching enzyme-like protein [Roseiflexus castenholzii DSM 13941]
MNQHHHLINEARERALETLHRCRTPVGFRASALAAGYPQIWARDNGIIMLGAVASGDPELIACSRAALETLGAAQSRRGLIPLNINPDTGYISTENAGAADSNLWFILGHYLHYCATGDAAFVREHWRVIDRAMVWLEYQDMNECGLIEIPEAGNWMDLLAVRYNTLYDNVLYYAAALAHEQLRAVVEPQMAAHRLTIDAAGIHERINLLFWIDRCWVAEHFAEHLERLKAMRLEWFMLYHNIGMISSRPFYLPWVAFREFGDWCDSLANLLAILTGVADGHRTEHILRFMHQVGMAEPYPTKAIHPPIYPGEANWREYYRSRTLNLPHQYHNGGIWPMIGGFHIAALVRHRWQAQAERLLLALADGVRQGLHDDWEFNEWMHGESGHPMGYAQQGWSAAMYLYADHVVRTGRMPLFDQLLAAKPASAVAMEINDAFVRPGGGPV